jgi:FkbM family methyltransferase
VACADRTYVSIAFAHAGGENGDVKLRLFGIALAVSLLSIAAIARLNPSSVVLLARDVKLRSPYCSLWKASIDGRIKLRQQRVAGEIARSSQIVRRQDGLILWSTPKGQFWIPDGEGEILSLLLAQEERNIYGTGEWAVQNGDVVLDVGAYIGTWTKEALARGAALVVAIEPSPASVECLRRNLSAEVAAGKVVIYPKGIWDYEGALTLFSNSSTGVGNSFVEENSSAQKINAIPVTTIDRLAAELKLARVNFIKADVKGATERLLRGGATVIRRDRPRIALSTEEPADDAFRIVKLAREILPAYDVKCGPCLLDGKEIYTDVVFFR